MPYLVDPAIAAGSLVASHQPSIPVGESALLRPWLPEDADAVVRAFDDPAIQRWHTRRLDSTDEALQLLAGWARAWSTETAAHWALVATDGGTVLGRMALKGLDLLDGNAGLAYWMVPATRGRGLCPAAVTAVSGWAFRQAGFHRLVIEHSTANPASCRVANKAGFAIEGVRRSAARHADGWHDMCVHSRLNTDRRTSGLGPHDDCASIRTQFPRETSARRGNLRRRERGFG